MSKVVDIGHSDTLFYIPHSTKEGAFKGVGDNSSGVVVFENQECDSDLVEVRAMPNSYLRKIKLKELCIAWLALNYPDVLKFDD